MAELLSVTERVDALAASLLMTNEVSIGTLWKVAVTDLLAVIFTIQIFPFAESHPVHPVKVAPPSGVAVTVTAVLYV